MSSQEKEYVRLLDSLARFYNSQITVHVGYQLTVTATVVGTVVGIVLALVTSIDLSSESNIIERVLTFALLVVGIYVYLQCNCRYLFKYLLGRTQYYIALSQAVWEHMGLKSFPQPKRPKEDHMLLLKKRALSYKYGIENAVISLFEARLFLSLLHGEMPKQWLAEPDERLVKEQQEEKAWVDRNLKEAFDLDPSILHASQAPYARGVFWYPRLEKLLQFAYGSQIAYYLSDEKKETEESEDEKKVKRKGRLLTDPKMLMQAECRLTFAK
jgi:hypothetical protein